MLPTPQPVPTPAPTPRYAISVQTLIAMAVCLAAGTLIGRWMFGNSARPTERDRVVLVNGVDLNRAGRHDLLQLPGIGEHTADEILLTRTKRGGFQTIDELSEVQGIGPAKLDLIRPHVRVDGKTSSHLPSTARSNRKEIPAGLTIDINRATIDELQKLPGIGPVLAQRIATARDKMPFERVEDLRRVSGVGPKTIDKLRPYVSFSSRPSGAPLVLDE